MPRVIGSNERLTTYRFFHLPSAKSRLIQAIKCVDFPSEAFVFTLDNVRTAFSRLAV